MTLDDLISAADPARGRAFTGGTVGDARRLIDQFDAERVPVAGRTRAWRPRRPRRVASVLVPVCGIVVAVLIAVLAGLVGQPGRTQPSVAPAVSQPSGSHLPRVVGLGPNAAFDRALIGELGILRQPQTAAARAFNTGRNLGILLAQDRPFIPSLTRAIQLPHRVILYLIVAQRSEIHLLRHGGVRVIPGGLGVELRAPFQGFGECCQRPPDLQKPVGPQATPYTMSQKPDWLYVELVPDGVATVRWTFPPIIAQGIRLPHHARTVTVRVHDNVAAIALRHPGSGNSGGTESDAWYSADGRLIARHTT